MPTAAPTRWLICPFSHVSCSSTLTSWSIFLFPTLLNFCMCLCPRYWIIHRLCIRLYNWSWIHNLRSLDLDMENESYLGLDWKSLAAIFECYYSIVCCSSRRFHREGISSGRWLYKRRLLMRAGRSRLFLSLVPCAHSVLWVNVRNMQICPPFHQILIEQAKL